jgi:two-component system sensor histidine kinase RegB
MRSLMKTTELRLINLRWLSVIAMLVVALLSRSIVGSFDLAPRLLVLAAMVGGINALLLLVATRRRGGAAELPTVSAFAQLLIDLLAWASYIYLSGGATNPLITIFLPLVAIGAMILDRARAWLLGSLAILAYSYLWRFYQPLAIDDARTATYLHISGMWLVFVVSDIVVVWFILQMTQTVRERDAALAAAREQAIRNDWLISMGSLAAGAAHELSTPLGTLNLLVDDLLDDSAVPEARHADLKLMQRQIETCKQALNQLTARAGLARGAASGELRASSWLKSLLNAWLALNPSLSVAEQLAPQLDEQAIAFDISVERAIVNLLDNARQVGATQIILIANVSGGCLQLSIEDDGPGIADAALLSFVAGLPMSSASGMGIGLLLARTAIERHGGRLEIGPLAGRGTRALIRLPLTREIMHEH